MAGRIFVTGGSGFVGHAVIRELLGRGYGVNALAHRKALGFSGEQVRVIEGSLFDEKALNEGIRDCVGVIHLVGIINEHKAKGVTFERIHLEGTRSVVDAAVGAGVRRYVQMSALGARPDAVSRYHKTKFAAEEYVRQSGLDWTIFRPSLIHGPKGEFMRMESKWARHLAPPFLFMPYFGAGPFGGRGAGLLQPVYVKDVARAFVDALEKPRTIGEVYPLAGPDRFTWPELHKAISRAVVGKDRAVVAMPVWVATGLTTVGLGRLLGFNRDQVIMSQENNVCDTTKLRDDLGWEPGGFEKMLGEYGKEL